MQILLQLLQAQAMQILLQLLQAQAMQTLLHLPLQIVKHVSSEIWGNGR
jgi:hypothetical protein